MITLNKTVRIEWHENDLHGKRGIVVGYVGTRNGFWTVDVDGWSVMIAADKLVPVRPVTTWVDEAEPQGAPPQWPVGKCKGCGTERCCLFSAPFCCALCRARNSHQGAPQTFPCARCKEGTVYRENYLCRGCSND